MIDRLLTSKLRWLVVCAFAVAVAVFAFRRTHDALLVQDGDVYMDMAASMADRGSLETRNGLDLVDSDELYIRGQVKIGRHLYGKYPALYPLISAIPYRLAKVPGLYALNAGALALLIVAYYSLARRLLSERVALLSTFAVSFATPLFSYVLMELPHLLSAGLLLAAIACFANVLVSPRHTFPWAAATGLLAGVSLGVRIQNIFPAAVLVLSAWLSAPRRVAAAGGQVAGLGACLAAMAVINFERFGTLNPLTYGPKGMLGSPPAAATAGHLANLGFVSVFVLVVASIVLGVRHNRARVWQTVSGALAVVVLVLVVPGIRSGARWMAMSAFSFLVNGSAFFDGWFTSSRTFGWLEKPLLVSAPFLGVGLLAMVVGSRAKEPLVRTLAWASLAPIVFLATLDPNPLNSNVEESPAVLGFLSLSPRYLVDVMPMLFLLAWWLLRDVRLHPVALLAGAAPGWTMYEYFKGHTADDFDPVKMSILLTLSIAVASVITVLAVFRRSPAIAGGLALASGLALAQGAATTMGVDTPAFFIMGELGERWSHKVESLTPDRWALIGNGNAKDSLHPLRSRHDIVFISYEWDDCASLLEVLRAMRADGRSLYYFGLGLERPEPLLRREYDIVQVSADPLLWRLDPIHSPPSK